ncbi:MAG: aminotransferase class V-fold PLP-dependent enzyme, partial [Clostridia bacterium]|nr:aminotransferase class V-fold PLP-dependent enzyme [Clostridia bacterium]
GILAINGNFTIKPLIFGGTGGFSLLRFQPNCLPESLESGTQNTVGIAGLAEGIKYINRHGRSLERNADRLYNMLYDELFLCEGVKLYSEKYNKTHTLAFNIRDIPSEAVTYMLNEARICVRGGFHCSALFHEKMNTTVQGMVRVSIGGFNTEYDIKRLIVNCKKILRG